MIGHLRGTLLRRSMPTVVLDAGGVGYELDVPLSTLEALPEVGKPASLEVVTLLRSESLQLFGFSTPDEKIFFGALLQVGGVGPRIALSILSTLSPAAIVEAARNEDAAAFERVPGIGRKTSRRLVLDLKDRLQNAKLAQVTAALPSATVGRGETEQLFADAVTALEGLGYRRTEAEESVRTVLRDGADRDLAGVIRSTLQRMSLR